MRKTRYQMHKAIDPDYYGFRDEEDGILERVERDAEKLMRAQVCLDNRPMHSCKYACMESSMHENAVLPA